MDTVKTATGGRSWDVSSLGEDRSIQSHESTEELFTISNIQKRQGTHLPHWRTVNGIYFVTFRLGDALPTDLVKKWLCERNDIIKTAAQLKWKSFTAHVANKILRRSGTFWQEEYHNHLIRDGKDLMRCIEYTWRNPEAASLHDWKWRWKCSSLSIASALESFPPKGETP